jgi:hypothetical protein
VILNIASIAVWSATYPTVARGRGGAYDADATSGPANAPLA